MFFRLLLLFFIAYVIISYVRRVFAPTKKKSSNYYEKSAPQEKEGKVSVQNSGIKKKQINKNEGDYVDFEEVKKGK